MRVRPAHGIPVRRGADGRCSSNLVVLDRGVVAQMDSAFADDLRYSKEMTLPEFERRPKWERVLEFGATLLSRVL